MWGAIIIALIAWLAISFPLGLFIGRVIRMADFREAESE